MGDNVIHIWITRQPGELKKDRFDELAARMPEALQKELYTYKRWQDAQASLAGKLLLQQAILEMDLPFSIHNIQMQHKDRPFIDVSFDFNISHSGNYIVLALSRENKVGIDIEKHRPLDVELFRKYFNEAEWEQIITAQDPLPVFFRFWTIKEAAIKCDGRGVEVLGKTKTMDDKTISCDETILHYSLIDIKPDYSCAVCSQKEIGKIISKDVELF